jgi:hypothetical protein
MHPRLIFRSFLVLALVTAVTGSTAVAAPRATSYRNCTALNQVYPHGVGRSGAHDKVRGSTTPVSNFTRNTAVYNANTKSDRDKDGVACEQR